jgi:hypothetical protein
MESTHVDEAVERLEKANAELEPDLLSVPEAREHLQVYARAQRLAAFGVAALARKIDEASNLARVTGIRWQGQRDPRDEQVTRRVATSERGPQARGDLLGPGHRDREGGGIRPRLSHRALGSGAHRVIPCAQGKGARGQARSRTTPGTWPRARHAARSARSYSDELGVVHVHLALEPHVGTSIVARAEVEAQRLARAARTGDAEREPFERYLADAYAKCLSGSGTGRARRPELVVLVSHEVARRGWSDVRKQEIRKIPGVGPVSPEMARRIAQDAFLSGVFYDGKDLRQFARWTRNIPIEVAIALELGDPPGFDGVACVDCGNRFRTEFDHVLPRAARGPTSNDNLDPRCWTCHRAKTKRDRRAGKLKPAEP